MKRQLNRFNCMSANPLLSPKKWKTQSHQFPHKKCTYLCLSIKTLSWLHTNVYYITDIKVLAEEELLG